MKKIIFIFVLLFCFLGCEAVPIINPIISGTIAWVNGEAHKYYSFSSDIIYKATKKTCKDLNYKIYEDKISGDDYYIIAGSRDRFKIEIEEIEPEICKLSIRVNFMGDKDYAELIYKNVDESLSIIEFDSNGNPVN